MRRDSIFYQLFQQLPHTLFELLGDTPENARGYRFDSVEVKEASFRIDGVFLPPEQNPPGTVYFCEVQFQKDEQFYERLFAEVFLYLRLYRATFSDWCVVIIYPSQNLEQAIATPYDILLSSPKVHRVYLNDLPHIQALPSGLALMRLTILDEQDAPPAAREIIERSQNESAPIHRVIIELLTTILVYKFTHLSREEVETMLGFTATDLKQTRFYQEAKEEGEQRGRQEGRQEGELALILRQLTRRFGVMPEALRHEIQVLSIAELENLGEALLDFSTVNEIYQWLSDRPQGR